MALLVRFVDLFVVVVVVVNVVSFCYYFALDG
jgi:hypothetical protein